jgi:chromosome segregation ATPase
MVRRIVSGPELGRLMRPDPNAVRRLEAALAEVRAKRINHAAQAHALSDQQSEGERRRANLEFDLDNMRQSLAGVKEAIRRRGFELARIAREIREMHEREARIQQLLAQARAL